MRRPLSRVAIPVPGLRRFHHTPGFEYDTEKVLYVVPRFYVTAFTRVDGSNRHPVQSIIAADVVVEGNSIIDVVGDNERGRRLVAVHFRFERTRRTRIRPRRFPA